MGISHLNGLCFLSLEFVGATTEALFCNFLCCTAACGPFLVTNMKALILHEHKIDHGKIFKWWSRGSLSLMIRNFSLVVWLRLRVQLHIFLKLFHFFKSIIKIFQILISPK